MNNTLKKNKVCAIIPFFNEAGTIEEVIDRSLNFVDCIIAVDDGSSDGSADNIKNNDRVIFISNPKNYGKGYALNTGFNESLKNDFEITITLDADLQHKPELIPNLVEGINNFDIVIGNRLNNYKTMPLQRIVSNKLTSFLLSLKTRQKLLDTQSGFRAYKTKILNDILPLSFGFEAESEILINAARKNYKIGFTPIPTIYGDEKSKLKSFQAIRGFIRIMMS